jgi:hypothetical protein
VKVTCLVFMLIAFASLTPGTSYAASSNQDRPSQQPCSQTSENTLGDHPCDDAKHSAPNDGGKPRKDGNLPYKQRDHRHAFDDHHARRPASNTTDRPRHLPNSREHSQSENGTSFLQPGSKKSGGAAKGGLIQNEGVKSGRAVRQPNVIRLAGPLPNNLRHSSANPAVIGGSASPEGKNTGAINGTRVRRRP